jgi:hypothetical protein
MAEPQYQYIKLPDGSWGKFDAGATDDVIRQHIQADFPDAYKPAPKPGAASRFLKSAADATGLSAVGHAIANPGETLTNIGKTIADPQGPDSLITKAIVPTVQNTVDNAREAWKAAHSGNPAGAVSHSVSAIPVLGPALDKATDQYADKDYAGEMGTLTGTAGALIGPKIIKEAAPIVSRFAKAATAAVPEAADATAAGIINKTVGSRVADFDRGANPGRGYVKSRFGPSLSMESIADKAAEAKTNISTQLKDAYAKATSSGKKIPAPEVEKAINSVIDDAKNSAGGPGVMADPEAYEELRKTFEPSLQSAAKNGGFTPDELWDIRKNIDRNLNWGDQSKLNMTKVQQRVSGSLGGLLKDAVPETVDLNQQYSDLINLGDRTEMRALTHSSPLTSMATKAAATAGGAILGHATPLGAIAGSVVGAAADSVPVKTALASGISTAGRAVAPAIDAVGNTAVTAAPAAVLPAALSTVPGYGQVSPVGDANAEENKDRTTNDLDHGIPPAAIVPPQPTIQDKEVVPANPNMGVAPVTLPVKVPAQASPIAAAPTPDTHHFSKDAWLASNPDGDVTLAAKMAKDAGYDIV